MDEKIRFGLYQSCGDNSDKGSVGHVSVFWLRWCRGVPSLKKILDIRTSNYENILVLKHFY